MKRVFIVEDRRDVYRDYRSALGGKVEIVWACALQEGREKFLAEGPFDLVVMDACVGDTLNTDTVPLVKHIRETYDGPIIAASNSSRCSGELMAAGCNHNSRGKVQVPQLVLQILGIE